VCLQASWYVVSTIIKLSICAFTLKRQPTYICATLKHLFLASRPNKVRKSSHLAARSSHTRTEIFKHRIEHLDKAATNLRLAMDIQPSIAAIYYDLGITNYHRLLTYSASNKQEVQSTFDFLIISFDLIEPQRLRNSATKLR